MATRSRSKKQPSPQNWDISIPLSTVWAWGWKLTVGLFVVIGAYYQFVTRMDRVEETLSLIQRDLGADRSNSANMSKALEAWTNYLSLDTLPRIERIENRLNRREERDNSSRTSLGSKYDSSPSPRQPESTTITNFVLEESNERSSNNLPTYQAQSLAPEELMWKSRIVKKGETLEDVCGALGISLEDLLSMNPSLSKEKSVQEGTTLYYREDVVSNRKK